MNLLVSMTLGIKEQFRYVRRSEKGVQTPDETLQSRRGSCRDFAVLMMEADTISWLGRSLRQRVHLRSWQRYESHGWRRNPRVDANLPAGSGLD